MSMFCDLSVVIAAASICVASAAYGQVVVAKGSSSETILQNGSTPINLAIGNNVIDTPTTFTCKSANGCIVILTASIQEAGNNGQNTTCSYVDGVPGAPGCGPDPGYYNYDTMSLTRAQAKVAHGSHTVQTQVNTSYAGEQVTGWETEYAVYEIK